MSVLIKSQSDIFEGMTDIRVDIHCNQPLAFPASLKKLRIRGVYNHRLVLPEGLEEIELGTYGMRVQLPKSIQHIKTGPSGYKILLLSPTNQYVTWETPYVNPYIKPHVQPLQIIYLHPFSSMYVGIGNWLYTMNYTEFGHQLIAKRCEIARLLYGILKMRKGYARDVICTIMRAIISNCFGELDCELQIQKKIKSF